MVPLRFSHHWAFWNGLFRGLPGLWAYLTASLMTDIIGYSIFVGPLGGSASSDVVGEEGRIWVGARSSFFSARGGTNPRIKEVNHVVRSDPSETGTTYYANQLFVRSSPMLRWLDSPKNDIGPRKPHQATLEKHSESKIEKNKCKLCLYMKLCIKLILICWRKRAWVANLFFLLCRKGKSGYEGYARVFFSADDEALSSYYGS